MTKPVSKSITPIAAVTGDRIELLQTFVRIVLAGSLSAAAVQMGTTQPTVSRRLQLLERSLGLRLLHRSTHAMKLTEDGERCFERAQELLNGWDAFETEVRGDDASLSGALRVVVPHVFGQSELIAPLAAFMHRHPDITVEWLLRDRSADFVANGIDCAIQVGEVTDTSLVAIELAEVPRMIVAAPSLLAQFPPPRHPRDLAAMPWLSIPIFYRRDISLRHARTGELCQLSVQPRLTTDSLFAMRSAAIAGLGLCIGSSWMLRREAASGNLVELFPDWQAAPLPVSVIYPYARFYPSRLRRFVDAMRVAIPIAVGGAIGTIDAELPAGQP
jgi:DNA-binding transcriptional LysR family regulator